LTDVFCDDVRKNAWSLICTVEPSDMLAQNSIEQLDPQKQGKVLSTKAKHDSLGE
jgi:hypothetical protein